MTDKAYPDFEPAWVEDPQNPGSWALHWLNEDGTPGELIGVDRECDVPGIHTPGASLKIQAMPLEKQTARAWHQIPAAPDA